MPRRFLAGALALAEEAFRADVDVLDVVARRALAGAFLEAFRVLRAGALAAPLALFLAGLLAAFFFAAFLDFLAAFRAIPFPPPILGG